jgi:hypothetical protein
MCRYVYILHYSLKAVETTADDVYECKMIIEKCQNVRQGEPCKDGSKIIDVVKGQRDCEWCNKDYKMPIMEGKFKY